MKLIKNEIYLNMNDVIWFQLSNQVRYNVRVKVIVNLMRQVENRILFSLISDQIYELIQT
jgi:hypothetical protein